MTMTSSKSGLTYTLSCPRMAAENGEYKKILQIYYFPIQTFLYYLGGTGKLASNEVHRVQGENMSVDYTEDPANLGGRYSAHQLDYKFLHFDICRPAGSCVRTDHMDIVLGTEIYK